eukprot:gnl/Spiro4/21489_TR10521_c0_g2_i1.p1 gnl/Spiro4/21489_TR10521_c0_g2~~gnl/Spiro4/21489_TR10521_c0_g2_i1.p1  ORF type:complete len:237 (-),score=34.51 gnl/Spiro4/21489_TR10521_c0_g2_i1:56-691(-)
MNPQQQLIENVVLNTVQNYERAIDAELEEDIDTLRRRRMNELRERSKMELWRAAGHGRYDPIDEKDFFEVARKSDRVVCHFARDSNRGCEAMDHSLRTLAPKHMETRFVRINAEKSPFLTERLKIWMLPSVVLIRHGQTNHTIVGLDPLGGEGFKTEVLEYLLSVHDVIEFDGPAPEIGETAERRFGINRGGNIRRGGGGAVDNSDSESDS